MNIVLTAGLILAIAATAQAIRLGLKYGDWGGLIPIVVIGLLLLVTFASVLISSGD